MASESIGRTPIPQEWRPAYEVAIDLGIQCMEAEQVAEWATPGNSPWKAGRSRKLFKQLRLDDLCADGPLPWCIGEAQEGRCIRDAGYWIERLRQVVMAADCGCDTLACPDCNTGGRPAARCRYCGNLTGWESAHIAEVRQLLSSALSSTHIPKEAG